MVFCRVYWGSHGCGLERGHDGPHICTTCAMGDPAGYVGAPPYYGPGTHFHGEDVRENDNRTDSGREACRDGA
jgi:hypothetical protein